MSNVRISFVVATYNGAAYVTQQLNSILGSLGPNDEIVISDDGSTDATVAQIRTIDDPRIRLIIGRERLGYQGNFARAIAAARGAYIFFSDQDDVCLPERVPLSLARLQQASCVCGDAIVVDAALSPLQDSHFAARRARFGAIWLFARPAVIGATLACTRPFLLANLPFPEGVP
ncbi:glycosyltransferase, partial [Sphingomonas sp. 179-A 2A2 NHS]|uniref:glycosyltransferase n=1 Tax=Sphingomonas sp. 179-A 2A2 NHS TaxID=3374290 RepID=UPI0038795744